jgi:hypothetical protein
MPDAPLRHNDRGAGRMGRAEPIVLRLRRVQAYLLSKDLVLAAEATVDKDAKEGINGGMMVFQEIASEFAPGHQPKS